MCLQRGSMEQSGSASGEAPKLGRGPGGSRRPSSLAVADPFLQYREPKPDSLRQTRETTDRTPDVQGSI